MLIKRAVLDQIVGGEIDLVYRRWKRPTVKTGGTLRTSVGMLDIVSVDPVTERAITAADAKRAGHATRADLLATLDRPGTDEGTARCYRIELRPGGPDPRLQLRQQADLDDDELAEVTRRLDRLDAASKRGPWTHAFLRLLAANPQVRAQDLADGLGLEKAVFKNDVRKLKGLGLTISHSPGYELSPRGQAVLAHLEQF